MKKILILSLFFMVTWNLHGSRVVPCQIDEWTGRPIASPGSLCCYEEKIRPRSKRFKTFQEAQDFVKTRPVEPMESWANPEFGIDDRDVINYSDEVTDVEIKEFR